MKKLREKLIIRSSSRRQRVSDVAPSDVDVASSKLAQPSSASPAAPSSTDKESDPQGLLKRSRPNPVNNTFPRLDHAPAPNAAPDETISPQVDGVLPIPPQPTSSAGPAKAESTESSRNRTSLPLNSSPLLQRAMDMVKTDDDWIRYKDIVTNNSALNGNDVDSPDGVVTIAKKLSDELQTSKTTLKLAGRTIVVREILNNVLNVLSVIKDVGASLTSLNPYASLAWGGLQFFVQAAVNNREVGALCWDELPRMLRLMSQYQTFETLYDTSRLRETKTHLEEALVQLFGAILNFQVVIVKYASSRTERFKAAFQDKLASMPKQILDKMKQHEEEVAGIRILADRETNDTQFRFLTDASKANTQRLEEISAELRQSNFRVQELGTKTATHIESVSKSIEATHRDTILAWISTIAYRDVHNSRDRKAMKGTGQWLVQHPEYIRWRSSKQTAVLWLHGLMGSGKSCLAHTVIEDVKVSSSGLITQKLAYFYCNGSSEQGRKDIENVSNILRCLLHQLARVGEAGRLMNSIIKIYKDIHQEGHLSDDQCVDLMGDLIDECETTTIVIDGLDECLLEVQNSLMTSIAGLLEGCLSCLRIFVSCRRNDDIADLLENLPVTGIDMRNNNTEDIEKFVRRTAHVAASNPGSRRKYVKDGLSQEDAVVDRLLAKAGGMFRWAQMAFDFLHASVDYDAMRARLDQLSHLGKLFDLYDKVYDDMMSKVDAADQARIRTLLTFMLHGLATPLDVSSGIIIEYPREIQDMAHILEACEFSATGDLCTMPMSVERVGILCPNLVVFTHEPHQYREHPRARHVLSFPHVSVREWLLTGSKKCSLYTGIQGHCYLAQLCIKFVSARGRQPTEIPHKADDQKSGSTVSTNVTALLQYSSRGWLDHSYYPSLIAERESPITPKKICTEELVLRTTLEDFLFSVDKQDPVSPDTNATGLQRWRRLLDHKIESLQVGYDEREKYFNQDYRETGMVPGILNDYSCRPSELVVPAFVCGILGHFCDLSRFQEAAMEVSFSQYERTVRSLAAVMVIHDVEAINWFVVQIQPSPQLLADALLLTVTLGFWRGPDPGFDRDDEPEIRMRAWIPDLIRILFASGLEVNSRHGPSETPLLVRLIRAWVNCRPRRRTAGAVAIIIASVIESGANAFVPITIEDGEEVYDLYWRTLGSLRVSQLNTVFDWILLWCSASTTEGIEALFLAQQWDKSVWKGWLTLAVRDPNCSPNVIESCLRNGTGPLTTDEDGIIILKIALTNGCSGPVLDLLSAATLAADPDLRMDAFDFYEIFLREIMGNCSRITIELWKDKGADITGITTNDWRWYGAPST